MSQTVTMEIPAASEALVRQPLALHEELRALALAAAEGTVLDACEAAAVPRGWDLTRDLLAAAVARRIEAAEKKGHPWGSVHVVRPGRTAAELRANS